MTKQELCDYWNISENDRGNWRIIGGGLVHKTAKIGVNVQIGNYAKIDSFVKVHDGVDIGHFVSIGTGTIIKKIAPYRGANVAIGNHTTIGKKCEINSMVNIGSNVSIGDNVRIMTIVHIFDDVIIGDNVEIHSGVKIYNNAKIANNVILEDAVAVRQGAAIGVGTIIYEAAIIGAMARIRGGMVIHRRTSIANEQIINREPLVTTEKYYIGEAGNGLVYTQWGILPFNDIYNKTVFNDVSDYEFHDYDYTDEQWQFIVDFTRMVEQFQKLHPLDEEIQLKS